jgi:membrane protein DedA with SNARE-associated domain
MDPAELFDLQDIPDIMPDIAELVPVEVLPMVPVPLQAAAGWVARILVVFGRHALLLAFFGAFIENTVVLGFLLPGGTVVALSGDAGRTASISLPWLVVLSALGMTAGAVTNYYCGKAGLQRVLARPWTGKIGRELALQLRNSEPLLRKHGWWVMLLAHAFGPGRSTLALAAGASGFSLVRFLIIELPAAFLWSALYAGGGFLLASEWQNLELMLRRIGWIGAALLVAGGLGYWWWHRRLSRIAAKAVLDETAETHNGRASWPETPDGGGTLAGDAAPAGSIVSAVDGAGRRRSESP